MTQQVRRILGRAPVIAGVILLAGVNGALTGSAATDPAAKPIPPLQGAEPAHKSLANTCVFPDPVGERPVTVDTKATLPKVVDTGKPIHVKDFSLTFAIPAGALGDVTEIEGAATVELTATREDKKTPVPVTLTIPATKVPTTGDLILVATGKVPDIVMKVEGELQLTTGAPSLALTVPATGTPLKPITCVQGPGQDPALGTVALLPLKPLEQRTGKPGEQKPRGEVRTADDPPDPNIIVIPLLPFELINTATISKVGAVARLKPGFMFNAIWKVYLDRTTSEISGTALQPPSKLNLLGFGFLPITGTMELLPTDYRTGNTLIDAAGTVIAEPDGSSTATVKVQGYGKLSNITVNGVDLGVGDNCVTAEPFELNLRGTKYDTAYGGVLRTDPDSPDPLYRGFTLPRFAGCGVKENLDSLLSGMSSGPGNQVCFGVNQVGLPRTPERECPNATPPSGR
ncbi:DUF6801 domain-containing protein [Amycolatopsis sp. EV170708-02-1]|uniref:DUF6801 domain-containing protein n=1 Tax=Amycolatopsis sp. EV170708-02-1 TaxID=2919322 RepID=UPI001F0CBD1D|nr:DUF6801 domain-containing protein [Amycolatopsis sp. EV170708-02-1]UMP00670.1 hypothetical protein MJQ72_29880 [Amycolatopsis sp. EV170708-02-1]